MDRVRSFMVGRQRVAGEGCVNSAKVVQSILLLMAMVMMITVMAMTMVSSVLPHIVRR